jgi:hypothetical protein
VIIYPSIISLVLRAFGLVLQRYATFIPFIFFHGRARARV